MNMANMANMANMGGPVGAQGQMLNNNNGALPHQGGPRQPLHLTNNMSRTQFHTYIYEYLLRTEFYDCARALYQADPSIHVKKEVDENGNGLGDDPMDTDMKELEIKRPNDLPAPLTATSGGGNGFLYDWFCIFWDIFTTSKGGKVSPQVQQYVTHNQVMLAGLGNDDGDLIANFFYRLNRGYARSSSNSTCSATCSEEQPSPTLRSNNSFTSNCWRGACRMA